MELIANIAIDNTNYGFDMKYSYSVPASLYSEVKAGCRVLVPFGNGNKTKEGLILSLENQEHNDKIKPIIAVLDKAPLLSSEMIELAVWMKKRYYCTLFDAIKVMRPIGLSYNIVPLYELSNSPKEMDNLSPNEERVIAFLKLRKQPVKKDDIYGYLEIDDDANVLSKLIKKGLIREKANVARKISDASIKMVKLSEGFTEESLSRIKLTDKQKYVLDTIKTAEQLSVKEICYFTGVTSSVIESLYKKGIVEYTMVEKYRTPYSMPINPIRNEIVLTDEQTKAYNSIYREYKEDTGKVSLLYGVTGSGKTSVFMKLIDDVLSQGKGVIMMVPEISLTPQMLNLFIGRYGKSVAVFHSGLSQGERMDEWKRVKNGDATIVLGTRSAVFAPIENLGLIVMDEEQEYTYKSESTPRFHARDIAKFRCNYHNALLLLSSATPSIESYYLANVGKYSINRLSKRYGKSKLPKVEIVDMNKELDNGNTSAFSSTLMSALKDNLANGKQSILLLNRRGHNTFISCRECGEVLSCPNCSISMTYHSANRRLMCHYCGYSTSITDECPSCHEKALKYVGLGTQKAEEDIEKLLPSASILRMDTDAIMSKFSYDKKLKQFSNGKYDIMIGTQMVAKGLNFENVTLVGVLSADQSLYSEDFRSYEKAFSLITQVVGRSGRGNSEGKAIIQTFTPENPIIKLAASQDYDAFYNTEIQLRKSMLYPPFSDICVIGLCGSNEGKTLKASKAFFSSLTALASERYSKLPIIAFPPSPAIIGKVNNKYRYKIIMKCRDTKNFRELMSDVLFRFKKNSMYKGINVFVDVNPDSIM